jgi:EpsI family protein
MKLKTIIHIAIITVAFLLLYHEAIAHMLGRWNTLGGSHTPLIFAVSLYLLWINRHKLRGLQPTPSILPGGLLLAAGCFTLLAGKISGTIVVQQLSMIPFLLGVVLLFAGFGWFKVFLLPVSYLIFLTGFIEILFGNISFHLQSLTAWISVLFFKIMGFSVFHEGTLIILPHISLIVVRECSGINQIVTLLALAVPLAFMTQKTTLSRIILIALAPIIAIIVNGLRVTLIGVYALYNEGANLHGPHETFSASVIFFFGFVVLILVSRMLSRKGQKSGSSYQSESASIQSSSSSLTNHKLLAYKRLASIFVGAIIFSITLGFMHFYITNPVELKLPLNLFPDQIAGFTSTDLDQMHERIRPFEADEELMRQYQDEDANRIELYIGYFKIQDRDNKIIDYRRSWMHEQVSRVTVASENGTAVINKTRLQQQTSNSDIYFWYQMDGKIIRNEYAGKFFTFMNSLFKRKNNAAVIIIKSWSIEDQIMPFLEQALPLIQTHLSGKHED